MSRVAVYSGPFTRKIHGLRGLGDVYDPVTGTYVPSLPAGDNPVVAPTDTIDPALFDIQYGSDTAAAQYAHQAAVAAGIVAPSQPGTVLTPAVAATQTPRPSPVVSVPLSPSTMSMWLGNSTVIAGLPNWATVFGGVALLAVIGGFVGGRRGKR